MGRGMGHGEREWVLWIYLEFVFENRIMKLVEIVLRNEGDER
jgi:hypothetical protein